MERELEEEKVCFYSFQFLIQIYCQNHIGYYDVLLFSLRDTVQKKSICSLTTVGIGFKAQILNENADFPADETDYQLDYIYQPKFV